VSDPAFDALAARPMITAHGDEMEPRPAPALILLARNLWSSAAGRVGLSCVLLIVGCAILDTWIVPYDPNAIDVSARLAGPSFRHWLGADQLGRDLLSRIIDGSRVVMGIVVIGVGVALTIGMGVGIMAGYGFRTVGAMFALFCDVIRSLPMMLFALAVASLIGTGLGTVTLIVIMFLIPVYFRVARNQTMVLKQSEYVTAARAMGASSLRVMLKHILPNLIGQMVVLVAMDVPTVIGIEAGLSFLGEGARPPLATWGSLLRDGFAFIREAPHIAMVAGVPIIIATIGFTFLGEALRDSLDPRVTRGHRH
jgi:peptide/nickel transport system permease protein